MRVYSAKWVSPMDGPMIENGEIVVEDDGTIAAVRPIKAPANERMHFENSVLLPGFVNAHTHLEYTALRGAFEDMAFFPWIRSLTAFKSQFEPEDWVVSAKMGALECLTAGITTIGDNTDSGASMDAALWAGLRGRIYQEFFCIDHRTSTDQILEELVGKVDKLTERQSSLLTVGISPHATYTINPTMFKTIREDRRISRMPISMHVAESPAESDLIIRGVGPFAEMFDRRGIVWNCPSVSPTRYVVDQGMARPHSLLIHCVHQDDEDICMVEESGAAIIHCPKSNAKLGAGIAPLTSWLKRKDLRLGIGTDSAVSNNGIDLFEEMRFALLLQRAANESVEPIRAQDLLTLATSRGAEALGYGEFIGTLTAGKRADLIAVDLGSLTAYPARDPITTIVYSARATDVKMTVINGRVCYRDGEFYDIDAAETFESARVLTEKLTKAVI